MEILEGFLNENGEKNGFCRSSSGATYIGWFKNDIPNGNYIEIKYDGTISEEGWYENGERTDSQNANVAEYLLDYKNYFYKK